MSAMSNLGLVLERMGVCRSIKKWGTTSALSLHRRGEKTLSPVIRYDLYLMVKAGSPVITLFCNETLLHPLDALIYLETANKYIENLKSKTGDELFHFSPFLCG